jgi:hypothetical protein
MNNLSNLSLSVIFSAMLFSYSGLSCADHGSLGFGIGTASPIITQTGVTLPTGLWAGGIITQFAEFDNASDKELLHQRDLHGDVHSVNTLLIPSIFAAYGVTDDLTFGIRIPYVLRSGVHSPNEDNKSVVDKLGDPSGFGDVSFFGQSVADCGLKNTHWTNRCAYKSRHCF